MQMNYNIYMRTADKIKQKNSLFTHKNYNDNNNVIIIYYIINYNILNECRRHYIAIQYTYIMFA